MVSGRRPRASWPNDSCSQFRRNDGGTFIAEPRKQRSKGALHPSILVCRRNSGAGPGMRRRVSNGLSVRRARLQASARELSGLLRYARHVAVLRGGGCAVWIDPIAGRYQLTLVLLDADGFVVEEEEPEVAENEGFRLSDDASIVHVLPKTTFFSIVHSSAPTDDNVSYPRIIFYPDGSATAASIGIQDEEGKAFRVDVFRTTGMTMVRPGVPVLPAEVRPLFYLPEHEPYRVIR